MTAIELKVCDDGKLRVIGGWPRTTEFAQSLFDGPDVPDGTCGIEGDRVKIEVHNGSAEYLVTDRIPAMNEAGEDILLARLTRATVQLGV